MGKRVLHENTVRVCQRKGDKVMWETINEVLATIDDFVWGVPLIVLILSGGLLLTIRTKVLQVRHLPLALKWMIKNEEEGEGEVTSFGALCTALSATIGTGNIVGVATAICGGGPGAVFWIHEEYYGRKRQDQNSHR